MDRDALKVAAQQLGITDYNKRGVKIVRFWEDRTQRLKLALTAIVASFLGWLMGRTDERLVSKDDGSEYPMSTTPSCFLGIAIGMGGVLAFLLHLRSVQLHGSKERIKHAYLAFLLSLGFLIFMVAYYLSRPVEYYSGDILYSVYSRERKDTSERLRSELGNGLSVFKIITCNYRGIFSSN